MFYHLSWGRGIWSVRFSCICLFVFYGLVFVIFSSSWCRGLTVVCDCGTPWTFLLTVLKDSNQTIGKTTEFIFLNMNPVNSLNLTFNPAQSHTRYSVKRDLSSRVIDEKRTSSFHGHLFCMLQYIPKQCLNFYLQIRQN